MSALSSAGDQAADAELPAELLSRFGFSMAMERAVRDLMQSDSIGFAEAAVRLNFMTVEQVKEVLLDAQRDGKSEHVGLVEMAIHKIASNRQVVSTQGETVTPSRQLILAHDADNPRSEKIRALRTELLLLCENSRTANTMALLSACAGEGRSQLAAELAISFSQLGRRALLVDADMRQPKQHVLFGTSNTNGLAEAISRNQKPSIHMVEGLPYLTLLTSGATPPNPLELLSDGRFAKLLQEWRKYYEFVVLDTPPVQNYADGLAIATLAGRVMLLSRGQHTSFADTKLLLRRLATTQSQILGTVINHF